MNGTYFLISQREFENNDHAKLMENSVPKHQSGNGDKTDDEKSMKDSVQKNRSKCLIW